VFWTLELDEIQNLSFWYQFRNQNQLNLKTGKKKIITEFLEKFGN
jgi:hypothetical protein